MTGTEDDPYRPPAEAAEPAPQPAASIPLHRAVLDAWVDLVRPRESILLRHYTTMLSSLEPGAARPATLDEARRRLYKNQPAAEPIEVQESKMVLAARLIAAWIVFWATILPALIIVGPCAWQLARHPGSAFLTLRYALLAALILCPFLCVLCMMLQGLLLRPFGALLGRVLDLAYPDQHQDPPQGDPSP
jgi:hypothetical protein